MFSFRSLASTILGTESFNPRRWTRLHEGWVVAVQTYFSFRMGFITALLVGAFGFGIQVGDIWHAYRRRLMRDLDHVQLAYYSDRNIRGHPAISSTCITLSCGVCSELKAQHVGLQLAVCAVYAIQCAVNTPLIVPFLWLVAHVLS